jgi:hypothetical protein
MDVGVTPSDGSELFDDAALATCVGTVATKVMAAIPVATNHRLWIRLFIASRGVTDWSPSSLSLLI